MRGYSLLFLSLLLVGLAALAGFTAAIDPFNHYRMHDAPWQRFYPALQRYQNPGLAKHASYDSIVTGSSLMENFKNDQVDAALGGRSLNLAQGAMTARELHELLGTAYRARAAGQTIRRIMVDLNFNAFSGPVDTTSGPLPGYLYDGNWFDDLHYLLAGGVALKSLEIVTGKRWTHFTTNAAAPWYWGDGVSFSRATTVAGLDPGNINKTFRQPPRTLRGMQESFNANLLPLIEAHPETLFTLIYPPYSLLAWADFAQRGQVEVTLEFKRWVFASVGSRDNVQLFDFQDEAALIGNLDFYKDIYHYSPEISRWMLRCIQRGERRVSAVNLEAGLRHLAALAQDADPVRLIVAKTTGAAAAAFATPCD